MDKPKTNPETNAQIVGILRTGNEPSQYAAQRIEELEAEVRQLRDELADLCEYEFRGRAHRQRNGPWEGWWDAEGRVL